MLCALSLDRVVYEARHRPAWLRIPIELLADS